MVAPFEDEMASEDAVVALKFGSTVLTMVPDLLTVPESEAVLPPFRCTDREVALAVSEQGWSGGSSGGTSSSGGVGVGGGGGVGVGVGVGVEVVPQGERLSFVSVPV